MPTITYFLKVLQQIVHYQNKFSMQFESFYLTVESGFEDILGGNIAEMISDTMIHNLMEDLNDEIKFQHKKIKHAKRQEDRRKRGLQVEDMDDHQIDQLEAEEENKENEVIAPTLFTENDIEDMVMTKIFDTPEVLLETIKFKSPLNSKELKDRMHTSVSIHGAKYKELYRDQEGLYRNRRARIRAAMLERQRE